MNRDMQSVSPAVPLHGQVPIEVLITSEYLWRFRMGSVGRRNHVSTLCMEISHLVATCACPELCAHLLWGVRRSVRLQGEHRHQHGAQDLGLLDVRDSPHILFGGKI